MSGIVIIAEWILYIAVFFALVFLIIKRVRDSKREGFDKRSN